MKTLPNNSVDMTLTDIPYGEVSRETISKEFLLKKGIIV